MHELLKIGTWGWVGEGNKKEANRQQFQARSGIAMIISGSVIQIILVWDANISNIEAFGIIVISAAVLIVFIMCFRKEYKKRRDEMEK